MSHNIKVGQKLLWSFLALTGSTVTMISLSQVSNNAQLWQIQNSLARAVVKASKCCHILHSLRWLKITECIECKILSHKVLTTNKSPAPHLGGQMPPNFHFWGVNSFHANFTKQLNHRVIETTAARNFATARRPTHGNCCQLVADSCHGMTCFLRRPVASSRRRNRGSYRRRDVNL